VNVNAQSNSGLTPLMYACLEGHLMAVTLLIGHGANLAVLSNVGNSALQYAEWRVAQDAAPPAAGAAPATAAQREQHLALVALLKASAAV